ncbi:MAG: class I SAM-dependent methyltransferase [bacterium]
MIASALGLSRARCILDLACGPGIYARRFAAELPAGMVTGMDLSWPMLRHAARESNKVGLDNLVLVRGDATELPFPSEAFDAVNCCGALHLFPDVGRTLIEIRRVLKDGGRFTVAAFRRGDGAVAQVRARLRQRLYGIGAFSPSDLAARFERAGFVKQRCLHAAGLWLIMSAQKDG